MPKLQEFKSDWADIYGVTSLRWFLYKKDHVCYHEWGGVQEKIMMQFKEAGLCQRDIKGLWSAKINIWEQQDDESDSKSQKLKIIWMVKKSSNGSSVNEHLQDTGVHASSVKRPKPLRSQCKMQDAAEAQNTERPGCSSHKQTDRALKQRQTPNCPLSLQKEETVKRRRRSSQPKSLHIICQTCRCFCHGQGLHGCQWNRHTGIYWWFYCWQAEATGWMQRCMGVLQELRFNQMRQKSLGSVTSSFSRTSSLWAKANRFPESISWSQPDWAETLSMT